LECPQAAGDTEQMSEERKRILTGVRPTGPLHLGHYVGALENWVRLQDGNECFFLLADYQVADYADRLDAIRSAIMDIALDWLAVGLDPSRSHFVVESQVPEHAELAQWLSWYLPLARLQRNPTLKSELADLELKTVPVAFFTYPVLQAANILLPRAHLVPVGEDQLPHIEMTRELARRLNGQCGPLFPEPQALVGRVPRLVGLEWPVQNEQVARERHLPERRLRHGVPESHAHVHRSQSLARNRPRPRGGQPGLPIPRCIQSR
jgi:tryptophanyl-tRNA synthetase